MFSPKGLTVLIHVILFTLHAFIFSIHVFIFTRSSAILRGRPTRGVGHQLHVHVRWYTSWPTIPAISRRAPCPFKWWFQLTVSFSIVTVNIERRGTVGGGEIVYCQWQVDREYMVLHNVRKGWPKRFGRDCRLHPPFSPHDQTTSACASSIRYEFPPLRLSSPAPHLTSY